jgi:hypothetical protein
MTYQPRTEAGRIYQQGAAQAVGRAVKPVMPVIDTWQKGVDIAGRYSPTLGALMQTAPTALGVALGAKPTLQAGRQASNTLGAMQARMIANANAPRTLNTGFMRQRGAINPSDFNLITNPDGTVTLYHGTTNEAAKKIIQDKKLLSAGEPDVYMTTDPMAGYGDGTVVQLNIDPKPRAHFVLESSTIKRNEYSNPNVNVEYYKEENGILKKVMLLQHFQELTLLIYFHLYNLLLYLFSLYTRCFVPIYSPQIKLSHSTYMFPL